MQETMGQQLTVNELEDTQKDRFLTFFLGSEIYGIEIKYVTEIIGIQEISEIPDLPQYVRGIINLRGKIIPVMDVRLRFNKPYKEYDLKTCIIVVDIEEISVGLIIDSVSEVLSILGQDIVPPIGLNLRPNNEYIKGIGKVDSAINLILDLKKLLNCVEVQNSENI